MTYHSEPNRGVPDSEIPGGNIRRAERDTCALFRNGVLFGKFCGQAAAEARSRNVDQYCGYTSAWDVRAL